MNLGDIRVPAESGILGVDSISSVMDRFVSLSAETKVNKTGY